MEPREAVVLVRLEREGLLSWSATVWSVRRVVVAGSGELVVSVDGLLLQEWGPLRCLVVVRCGDWVRRHRFVGRRLV